MVAFTSVRGSSKQGTIQAFGIADPERQKRFGGTLGGAARGYERNAAVGGCSQSRACRHRMVGKHHGHLAPSYIADAIRKAQFGIEPDSKRRADDALLTVAGIVAVVEACSGRRQHIHFDCGPDGIGNLSWTARFAANFR